MRLLRTTTIVLLALVALGQHAEAQSVTLSIFERYLESLRQQVGIPGLSAAIVQGRRVLWERGFGLADVENSVPARADTPYPIADLTQTFASTVLLQCVEQGGLELSQPIGRWLPAFPSPAATIQQVLSHSSESGGFRYDLPRYAGLTPVVEDCGDDRFRKVVVGQILDRLGMSDSVPGYDLGDPSVSARSLFTPDTLQRYGSVLSRMAAPYKVDRRANKVARGNWPSAGVNAATGLVSTVQDLARFDAALDDRVLLRDGSLALAWTNASGAAGLGWFVQNYNGERIVWQFGMWPDACSSLVLKVPGRDLTLILLANSDGLSASFSLENGDVTSSLFARLFLHLFIV